MNKKQLLAIMEECKGKPLVNCSPGFDNGKTQFALMFENKDKSLTGFRYFYKSQTLEICDFNVVKKKETMGGLY